MSTTSLNPRRWTALVLLCVANFMVTLDSAIVILGLPSIQRDLGFGSGDQQWVISAYLVSFGGLLLLGGRSSDLLGRRRMFLIGTALFLLSSLLCGLAWSAGILVAARVIQGASAALMAPTALGLLTTTFTVEQERNRALGIWTGTAATGATAALLIGGPLTTGLGWQWIFFINVPVAFVLLLLTPMMLSESRESTAPHSFDPLGAITITVALVALVYAVSEAPKAGWGSAQTIGLLIAFVVLVALFVLVESRHRAPLAPLRVFRSRNLVGGNLSMLLAGTLAFGMPFALTEYAQQVLGYSALRYGFSTVAFTAMAVVGATGGQVLIGKIGFRIVAATGMLLLAGGCALLTRVSVNGSYFSDLFLALLIFGVGLGSAVASSTISALSSAGPEDAGLASGVNTAAFQIGGAVGVAVVSTIVVIYTTGSSKDAVTGGLHAGFVTCVGFGVLGIVNALLLLRSPGRSQQVDTEPASTAATAGN